MAAQRYLHVTGATSEDLGRVAVADRRHAAANPRAWFYEQPITLEEHQASRWIVEPLHLLDCCQETDGGQALVVTSLERARDLPSTPAVIRAAAQGSGAGQDMMTSYYRDDLLGLPEMAVVARQLWDTSGLTPADMQAAEGVRLVRGTSTNQVPDVEHVVVTAGTGVPTSGLVLGVDR